MTFTYQIIVTSSGVCMREHVFLQGYTNATLFIIDMNVFVQDWLYEMLHLEFNTNF